MRPKPDGPLLSHRARRAAKYVLAAALVALTMWLRLLLGDYADNRPLVFLFFLPILLSSYFGGLGPGWLATGLSSMSLAYFIFPPLRNLRVHRPLDLFHLLVATAVGGLLSWLIEESRRSARALTDADASRRSDARFRSALDSMMEGCQIVGFDWRWLYINEVAARYGRRAPGEFPGRSLMELYAGIEATPLFTCLKRCMDDRVEQQTETEFGYPDGTRAWFRVGIRPVPEGILIVSFDVTAHRQAAQALRESHERTRAIIDTSPDGVITIDHAGRISEFNPAAERIFGHRREDVQRRALADVIIPRELRDAHRRGLARYLATGEAVMIGQRIEVSGVRADGSPVALELSVNRMPGAGPPMFAGFVRDISERKKAERALGESQELQRRLNDRAAELEAANKGLDSFTRSVSHDLRSPLQAILGFAGIMARDHSAQLPAQAREHLDDVIAAAHRMDQLVSDLLRFSRVGQQAVTKQAVKVGQLVQEVLAELEAQRSGREVQMVVGDLPDAVADRALLKQVFANLLSNAFKFTRKKERARVEVGCRTEAGRNVYFVRDDGAGFDMRYAERLFEVFQRMHRSEEFEGTGVGLSLAHLIVQRHGGRMWAEAEVNRGATFHFRLTD